MRMIEFSNLLDNLLLNSSKKKKSRFYQITLDSQSQKINLGFVNLNEILS